MKYGILGDIHSNLEAFEAVLAVAKQEGVEKFICIGDVVGYNANPHECLELLRTLDVVAIVKGNHDDYVSNGKDTLGFNPFAAKAIEWTRSQLTAGELSWLAQLKYRETVFTPRFGRFELVHATLDAPEAWGYIFDRFSAETCMMYQKFPLCFVGHTHVPLLFDKNEAVVSGGFYREFTIEPNHKYLVNVGGVGQPRDGDPRASFAILSTDERRVRLYRVEYDIGKAQQKIREAGLPDRLADRLAVGR